MARALIAALLLLLCGHAQAQNSVGPLQAQRNLHDLSSIPAALDALGAGGFATKSTGSVSVQWTGGSGNVVVADTYYLILSTQWTGTITSVDYLTGGSSAPAFTATVQINGVSVTGCAGLVVNGSSKSIANCTGANSFTSGQPLTLVVSGVTGMPFDAIVSVNYAVTR